MMLLLGSVGALAQPPAPPTSAAADEPSVTQPPWRAAQGFPDITTALARKAPLAAQSTVLMGLDFTLPLLVAIPGALVGAGVGATLGTFELPFTNLGGPRVAPNPGAQILLGAVVGALVLGSLSLLGGDLVFNTFHLGRMAAARISATAVLLVGLVTAGMLVVVLALPALSLPTPLLAALTTFAVWACCMSACFLPPLALVAGVGFRMAADYLGGSALWEEVPAEK